MSHNPDNMADYSDCTSLNTIDLLHDYAVENLGSIIVNWSSEFFRDAPANAHTYFEEMIFNSDIEDEDTMEEEWLEQLERTSDTDSLQEVEFILAKAEVQVPVQENPMGDQARIEQLEAQQARITLLEEQLEEAIDEVC